MSISERLKGLLLEQDWSTRHFQEEVRRKAGEGTRGVSYASVWEYVEGKTEPPLSFIRVASEVLGVREGWLATGEGPPTDASAAEAKVADQVVVGVAEEILSSVRLGFSDGEPDKGRWLETDSIARAALIHAWRRRRDGLRRIGGASPARGTESPTTGETGPGVNDEELAREIGAALRGALDALKLDDAKMPPDAREDFVMGMAQAIRATVHSQRWV